MLGSASGEANYKDWRLKDCYRHKLTRTPRFAVDVNAMRAAAENLKAAKIREILAVATSIVKEAMLNGDHETVEFVASQIGAGSHGHAHSRGKVKVFVGICVDVFLVRIRSLGMARTVTPDCLTLCTPLPIYSTHRPPLDAI